jgi:hypothetical protein
VYKSAKLIADYVRAVILHTAIKSGQPEDAAYAAASNRVLEQLTTVVENALRGDSPEDIAAVLAEAIKSSPR